MPSSLATGVVTLSTDEADDLLMQHPELDGDGRGRTVVAFSVRDPSEAVAVLEVLAVLRERVGRDRDSADRALRALLPEHVVLPAPVVEQTHRDATARAELVEEFGLLSSNEVAHRAGSRSVRSNPAAMASRWRSEGKVFAVGTAGGQRYPGFQFNDSGRPLPVISDVLVALGGVLTGWELALWFTTSNSRLGDLRPVDVLAGDRDLVVDAAGQLAADLAG